MTGMVPVFSAREARVMLPRHWTRFGAQWRANGINRFGITTVEARVHRLGWFDFRAMPYIDREAMEVDVAG